MKTKIHRLIVISATLFAGMIANSNASNLKLVGSWNYWSTGNWNTYSNAGKSIRHPSGLGYGKYVNVSVKASVKNYSSNRSGSVALLLGVAPFYGSTTSYVAWSSGWGANASNVFNGYEQWTCTKANYLKYLNRSGYARLTVQEYGSGGWYSRNSSTTSTWKSTGL